MGQSVRGVSGASIGRLPWSPWSSSSGSPLARGRTADRGRHQSTPVSHQGYHWTTGSGATPAMEGDAHVLAGRVLGPARPSILAQLRGHHAAGLIILMNLGADAGLFYCMFHGDRDNTSLALPIFGGWLASFLWSLGK